jgi:hypothetical protein
MKKRQREFFWFVVSAGSQNETEIKGTYVHLKLVYHVTEWKDFKYVIKVRMIMDVINDKNFEILNENTQALQQDKKTLQIIIKKNLILSSISQ